MEGRRFFYLDEGDIETMYRGQDGAAGYTLWRICRNTTGVLGG